MTNHKLIEAVTKSQLRTDLPSFRPGDTLRVHVRIIEGTRERIQVFEGVVIKRRGGGVSETLQFVKFHQVLAWNVHSHYTHQKLKKSKLNVVVKYVVLNYITYVVYVVKLLESKKFVNQHLNKAMYESNSTQTIKPSRSLLWSDIDGFFCCLVNVKLIM